MHVWSIATQLDSTTVENREMDVQEAQRQIVRIRGTGRADPEAIMFWSDAGGNGINRTERKKFQDWHPTRGRANP